MKHVLKVTAAAVALAALFAPVSTPADANFGFATFWAPVNVNGTTHSGSGGHSSSRPAAGTYIVRFMRPVRKGCAYAATTRGTAGGQASVQPVAGKPAQLEVRTFNKSGGVANLGFTLLVSCV